MKKNTLEFGLLFYGFVISLHVLVYIDSGEVYITIYDLVFTFAILPMLMLMIEALSWRDDDVRIWRKNRGRSS